VGADAIGPIEDVSDAAWRDVMAVNVDGAFRMAREAFAIMRRQKDGVIINVASISAVWGLAGLAAYNASKAAVVSLTQTLAVEGVDDGVRANAIVLGPMKTAMGRDAAMSLKRMDGPHAKGRGKSALVAAPADVADAIAVLCQPAARLINGAVIPIDHALVAGGAMTRLMKAMASGFAA
jgi:NAD(P)-dependent dehydrogenase (short-subunit alcohol dehydrogenase family)